MKVTVVIPTKNEEHNLLEVIQRVRPYADEILVIDGHSTDRTREVAEAAGVRVILDNKKGKGAALRHVVNFVQTEITVFIDADGSHDPEDIPKLTYPLLKDEADMVVASRLTGRQLLHNGNDKLALQGQAQRKPERLSRHQDRCHEEARPCGEYHHDRAGNNHEDPEKGVSHRGSALA
jgi:glycosyltransferase involved in cell wall biosynthesis